MTYYAKRTEASAPKLTLVNSDELERALRRLHESITSAEDALIEAAEREKKLASLNSLATDDLKARYPSLDA